VQPLRASASKSACSSSSGALPALCCAVLCQAPSFGACGVRRQRLTLLFFRSYSRDKPRFNEHLDAVKFICKEFWNEVFSKQIDNLKTNYRVGDPSPAFALARVTHSLCCVPGRVCAHG